MNKPSVMIVDDSNLVRMRIRKLLKEHVGRFWEASDGVSAVNLYELLQKRAELPDIIFMDITMRYVDGAEASQSIIEMNPDARIIIVSAVNSADEIKRCIGIGVRDYLVKPFLDEKLLAAFHNQLDD